MPWQDRLRAPAYESPSGARFPFIFEDVSRSVTKQGTPFNFPDAKGTFVQGLKHTGYRYPLRLFFTGDKYDQETAAFEEALLEDGIGRLEHPIYGVIDVIPLGDIKRRDDLKTAGNQAVLEVTFWETIRLLFPTVSEDPGSVVLSKIREHNKAAAAQLEETLDLDTASETATFKNQYQRVVDVTKSGLQSIADTNAEVQRVFNAVSDSINSAIDTLVSDPLTLASQTNIMLQAPARAITAVQARLDAYGNLASSLISGPGAVRTPSLDSENANAFRNDDLFASTLITGSILSVINNQFETKPDALTAAEAILDLADSVNDWRDDNLESLGLIDTGEAYQQLQAAVALAAGFLVQISFSLKQERRVVLDRPRSVLDIVSEFYGEVDEQIDFFITSNDLTGDEIAIELQAGREVVYYV